MHSHNRVPRLALFLLCGSLLGGCSTSPLAPEKVTEPKVQELAPGLHPIVAILAPSQGIVRVELRLKPVAVEGRIASYQGRLSYAAERITLDRVELPAGVSGAANEKSAGTVRFVGAALDGLAGEILAVAHFRADGPLRSADFSLVIEEVAATGDLRNLSSLLVSSAPAELASH